MAAKILVPTLGTSADRKAQEQTADVFTLNVRPIRARLVSNNWNEADELDLTVSFDEAGLDPRYLRAAEVYFYLADGSAIGDFVPSFDNLRFIGMARDVTRDFTESNGKLVTIHALDYTCLFLESKNYPQSAIPKFSSTLADAWRTICDNTGYVDVDTRSVVSTVGVLRDRIDFLGGIDQSKSIGSSLPQRLAKGRLQMPSGVDAWAIWRTCCESLGLITCIRGDRCIVATATDFYTADDPPRFVTGRDVLELHESRELGHLSSKNICIRSYDPRSGKTLEAFFPDPRSSLARKVRKKRLGASATKAPKSVQTQDYDLMDLPFPVVDQFTLNNIAQRIWYERVRQELHGYLTTREMFLPTVGGSTFDLLKLQAGDQVQINIDRTALDAIQLLPTVSARTAAMIARGYSQDMAVFVAKNLDSIDKLPAQFLVHAVETEFDAGASDGAASFNLKVEFLNLVDIAGSGSVVTQTTEAPPIKGKNQPPIRQQTMTAKKKT